VLGDVLRNRWSDEPLDRFAARDALARHRGGRIDGGHLQETHVCLLPADLANSTEDPLTVGARAGCDGEVRQRQQLGRFAPGAERACGVGSNDERQLRVGVACVDGSQGIHGIGQAAALHLRGAHVEPVLASDGQPAHGQAMRRTRIPTTGCVAISVPVRLVRGGVGGHEQHKIERQLLARMAGHGEMPQVGRVECAAEDAERSLLAVRPAGRRLRRPFTRGRVRRLR